MNKSKLTINMEGKFELQFEDNEYYLVDSNSNDTVATTDKVLLKEYDGYMKKLSLKNCQAIQNGYDLDELAEKHYDVHIKRGHTKEDSLQRKIDFILGFQKAIELLGDKKFSEEDMRKMYDISCGKIGLSLAHDQTENNERFLSHLRSIQQTEWDVEIEMEEKWIAGTSTYGHGEYELKPKLDSNGCLILKKV